ncbi:hypothetical protein DL768_000584 [Monosporascus sp. mg162]|nr:hypothetical protein DL768_000584 [Monosporascus sp. mg162]
MTATVEKVAETIKDVTNTLSNTSITGKDDNKDAVHASAAEGRRLYIGNLAYATTEGELKEFFKGYLVESVSIPKNPRTDRPVGYAFVDLSTPTEAERAIAELSGKDILERKVSVQLARTPQPAGEKPEAGANGEGAEGTRRRSSGRGRGRGRGRTGRAGRGGRSDGKEDAPTTEGAPDTNAVPANNEVLPLTDVTNKTNTDDTQKKKENRPARERPARERPARERGPPADGIPSKNKVMVANLPYDLTEDKLKELFEAYEPSSAKIALRPIPRFMIKKLQARGEPRKGRGFGFVTLASEEMQQKAVAEMNGREIEGREIAVKVAIDSPDKTDDEGNYPAENETNGQGAAAPPAAYAPAGPPTAYAPAAPAAADTPADAAADVPAAPAPADASVPATTPATTTA